MQSNLKTTEQKKGQVSIADDPAFFQHFKTSIDGIEIPERFTFPFYYDPHPLAVVAASELQDHLASQSVWQHNFGLDPNMSGHASGKMFGVLVVQTDDGRLGYLNAFSGKLADANDHEGFVPPIYDMLRPDGFFNQGMLKLNRINRDVIALEKDPQLQEAITAHHDLKIKVDTILKKEKAFFKEAKRDRKRRRSIGEQNLDDGELQELKNKLIRESLGRKQDLQAIEKYWEIKLFYAQLDIDKYQDRINELKKERKALSNHLQDRLFQQYDFLNIEGERINVIDIFKNTTPGIPPSGAGDCAAPKLLQYAFQYNLKPICMAEFWWGKSPKSEIRKHAQYYPSCRGKCEPILGHMLKGLAIDPNPMLVNSAVDKVIPTVYEDEVMAVVNKPADMLSVPGKTISDSVATRMKAKYPEATGPLIVHRLDMSTSGLIVIAKSKEVHKMLQAQFIERSVEKRYVALLEGIVKEDEGYIELPMRVDLDDRPRQVVCYEYGKMGRTKWKVIERKDNRTRIHFHPITGRTHQLRIHASHQDGLNCPIVGDDLYGRKSDRLHLHAESITFDHPVSGKRMEVKIAAPF